MSGAREWLARLRGSVVRRRREARIEEEIRHHLEQLAEEYQRGGLSPAEARFAARRAFGQVDGVKERYRDQGGVPAMETLLQDVRIAARMLRRRPSMAMTAVAVLALGIGANSIFFTFVNAICLRGLPLADAGRVMAVRTQNQQGQIAGLSYLDYRDLRDTVRGVTRFDAFTSATLTVGDDREVAERFPGDYVSAGAFAHLGIRPLLGREFEPRDEVAGAPLVVVVDEGLWRSRYERDRTVIGREIRVDGKSATVIGIMPQAAGFPTPARVWLPLTQAPGLTAQPRTARTLFVFGRLVDGVTATQAAAEVAPAYARLTQAAIEPAGIRVLLRPINEEVTADITNPAWVAFLTAGVLIVIIGCATVANLLLMRAVDRGREIAVRAALGATRGRLVRQLLAESALLAGLGGVLGLGLSAGGVRLLSTMLPEGALPYWMTPRTLDVRVFAVLVAVCVVSVFAFGLAPALLLSKRGTGLDLHTAGRSNTPGYRVRWWSTALVGLEVGLTVVLLAAVGVMARTAVAPPAGVVEPDGDSLLTAAVTLPVSAYPGRDTRMSFYDGLAERLRSTGLVTAVVPVTALPLGGAPSMHVTMGGGETGSPKPAALMVAAGERYFEALGVPMRTGRSFSTNEWQSAAPAAVVNERFVATILRDANPIGRRLGLSPAQNPGSRIQWFTIVGVAANVRQTPRTEPDAVVYVPFRAFPAPNAMILVRTDAPAQAVVELRNVVRSLDRTVSVDRAMTFAAARRQATWNTRLSATLATGVTLLALVLALVGVHGLAAHVVAQRAPEIAVRLALGARAGDVGRLVLRRLAAQLAVGLFAGALLLLVLRPIFQGVDDPLALGAAFVGISAAMLAACLSPLRRAIATKPMQVLRSE